MNGYLVTFYTELNERYQGEQIHEWLLKLSKEMHFSGATVTHGDKGIDHTGKLHSTSFFELIDEPIQIQFALTETQTEQLFDYLNNERVSIFYVKTPVQFGTVGNLKGK
ncbi:MULTISPECIES: DUF190 domain-containing protein [Acinetobacter calcoaceticus/baumannii complex]|uniref:DUF190 domain-containing protein n=1 Tax=Acinetobacter TaxID=469 RepID=UPI00028E133F|nr:MULTISPECIES: DUF190 domain-containing protein [Acinetobacter calcoaceticus/baumannii complex]HAW6997375.1 DUF190 domain-containing protein [Acinetobacter baumannii]EKK08016.1 hypothetical protein ACIN5162_2318 [Acinetobacter baumannii OIFC0162]MBP1488335.1 DUF190 domain-containing protein [Acinetobacter nosocomialis]MEC6035612.1 DUF190 domain-containing protein [Acinetobacter nosocomialis]HAW7001247.1 DUF190 domain-containing protein [Acinetobacter baumannii]